MAANYNPKVDAYLAKAKPFAQPILDHLRNLIHKACPDVEETIKWSRPFFEYRGTILCNISAFKEHCSLGFWGQEMAPVLQEAGVLGNEGMGSLGRITSLKDLPSDKLLIGWLRQAADSIAGGRNISPIAARHKVVKAPKPTLEAPPEFTSALSKSKKASSAFASFSPSARREYIEWIVEAKRPQTRDKRIATALEWIAEGKQRNWKYESC